MNRSDGAALITLALIAAAAERRASACGGCFHPPTQTASDITDERMLLSVSTTQTTLYDQIRYAGSPSSFAWVLPIHGTVTVGLSADVLFDSIDVLTNTEITAPPRNCPSPLCPLPPIFAGSAGASVDASAAEANSSVTVTKQENVGPYATVQLHSTDSTALSTWLTQNGFNIPDAVKPIIAAYVAEGFDFLAMKLLPNQGVQAMRPVRVSTSGASLSLPLRMAAIGTGATVGITIWVVGDERYEPQNFPFFHIEDSALVWDWATSLSNYTTLRSQHEAALNNAGWEIESSIDLNEQLISNVIVSGGRYYGGGGLSFPPTPSDATEDYLPAGDAEAAGYESADAVRTADVTALFAGMAGPSVRLTRIRSDIAHAAMTTDFVLRAASDQSELSNVRYVTQSVNLQCPIYNGCSVVGTGTPEQAAASIRNGDVSDGGGANNDANTNANANGLDASWDATALDAAGAADASVQPGSSGSGSGSSSSPGSAASGSTANGAGASGLGASGTVAASGTAVVSGTMNGAGPNGSTAKGDGGGCSASVPSREGAASQLGALAGVLAVFVGRMARTRRRAVRVTRP